MTSLARFAIPKRLFRYCSLYQYGSRYTPCLPALKFRIQINATYFQTIGSKNNALSEHKNNKSKALR